jgi:AcrR family transcriptional regulator
VDSSLGRREENKQRTRAALERAAARLFEENGFAATTVRDIAAAAGVGERTFFRYFPSKEDLILQQVRDLIPGVMDGVRARPAAEPPLVALREAIVDWLTETGTTPTILVTGPPKETQHHSMEAHALQHDLELAIIEAFLDRLAAAGADRTARSTLLRAAVQAGAGVSALRGLMIADPACAADLPDAADDATACAGSFAAKQLKGRRPAGEEPKPTAAEVVARVREAFAALEP